MRISQTEIDSVIAVYRTRAVAATRGASGLDPSDAVDISRDALLMGKVRSAYERLPDVREERVRELRRRIQEGKYYVPTDMLVEKLLGRLTSDVIAVS